MGGLQAVAVGAGHLVGAGHQVAGGQEAELQDRTGGRTEELPAELPGDSMETPPHSMTSRSCRASALYLCCV